MTPYNICLGAYGFAVATGLLLIVSIINVYSLRWLFKLNNFLTILKLIIPVVISLILLYYFFSFDHVVHPAKTEFAPFGINGILAAISSGGIVFAFNGFKVAAEMAGEAQKPKVTVPLAIVGSVVICLVVYLLLQVAFLSAIPSDVLSHGWTHMSIDDQFGPFATITKLNNLNPLLILIFIGAIIGPFAAALMYVSSSARSLFGMSSNDYLPSILKRVSPEGNPVYAIVLNFFLGLLFFAPLPGWNSMASFLTSLMALTYVIAPISLFTLRKHLPEYNRPFKLVFGKVWSLAAFYACTLMVYWSGWNIVSKAGFVVIAGLVILLLYTFFKKDKRKTQWNFRQSIWLWVYFIGISFISYAGDYGEGARHWLNSNEVLVSALLLCFICLQVACKTSLKKEEIKSRIDQSIEAHKQADQYVEEHFKTDFKKK